MSDLLVVGAALVLALVTWGFARLLVTLDGGRE
jgi:hypothetical protein